jgi:leucyl aminopeptidase
MRDYAARGTVVKALLNQDMTGYSPNNRMAVIQDYVSAPLSALVVKLVTEYTAIPVVTTRCGYACSDHASATAVGYREPSPPASGSFPSPSILLPGLPLPSSTELHS